MESVAQLVIAIIRNHSAIAISCAGPVISAVNSIHKTIKAIGVS